MDYRELVWNRVKEGCAMGYLLGASSRAVTMEERAKGIVNFDDVGIVTSHAYCTSTAFWSNNTGIFNLPPFSFI
jgi:hypothetical protein